MSKALLLAGGILNLLFGLLHLFLGYQISRSTIAPNVRDLIEALNVAATLLVFFLAYACFSHRHDLLETGLGRAVMVLAVLLYWSRAAEEFIWFNSNPVIFVSCLLTGAVFVALLALPGKHREEPVQFKAAA